MTSTVQFEIRPFEELGVRDLHDLLKLRSDVFLVEQGITAEPDLDGLDPGALHVLGRTTEGDVVATARIELGRRPTKVARVVVHPAWRHRGIGRALMARVHERLTGEPLELSAQAHLVGWYEALGWRAVGEVYDEAGVPHRRMTRTGFA